MVATTLTIEDVKLAAEYGDREAVVKKATQALRQLEKDEKARRKLFDTKTLKEKKKALHTLRTAAEEAGRAQTKLMLSVPQELRAAVDEAERAERKIGPKIQGAEDYLAKMTDRYDELKEAEVEPEVLDLQGKKVAEARAQLEELEKEADAVEARVAKTRREARAALDASIKKVSAPAADETESKAESAGAVDAPPPAAQPVVIDPTQPISLEDVKARQAAKPSKPKGEGKGAAKG